ncbi:NYN domain-containing protein [Nocardioides iriomotensis]|uniref:NYN domain-containing protein n=1 Tax=Nocardioides iriomotensis TaxID=715784 RepID=A0A4Q5J3B2_9ACTN|nr:NYN domain-containing protein [Nocardioides iriomotensis]RYU12873.1 NYN domain-containing protein [Nocardioides iriomotensis]
MTRVRTALYLDFDNVFSGLHRLDPAAAKSFAQDPGALLERLATSSTLDGQRAWLVRRCYMNPNGWIAPPGSSSRADRIYFSGFRPYFTRAGFDVVDCPSLTQGTKNAADIRLVLDAFEALSAPTRYDEFVLASGDSDLTPLLVRIRAADRRTTILSPFDAAAAFTAVADKLIDGQRTLELLQEEDDSDPAVIASTAGTETNEQTFDSFGRLVREKYASAAQPINLATLAHELNQELGTSTSGWFGHGSFAAALRGLDLPGLTIDQHLLWDARRHEPPALGESVARFPGEPPAIARLAALQNLPRLDSQDWRRVYGVLAEFAATHPFSATEATKWSRDQLTEAGAPVSRGSIGFVMNGAAYGGSPLHRSPAPTADEIAGAFVKNALSRARAAGIELSDEEEVAVADWLGRP